MDASRASRYVADALIPLHSGTVHGSIAIHTQVQLALRWEFRNPSIFKADYPQLARPDSPLRASSESLVHVQCRKSRPSFNCERALPLRKLHGIHIIQALANRGDLVPRNL